MYALTGNQRVPDWLLASLLRWRGSEAFVIAESLSGQANADWKRGQRVACGDVGENKEP